MESNTENSDLFAPFHHLTNKEQLINHIANHPEKIDEIIQFAGQSQGWRACWALTSYFSSNNQKLNQWIDYFLASIPEKSDGHQREILKLLLTASLDENQEGYLFDIVSNLWTNPKKIPSLRMIAWEHMFRVCIHFPELRKDLELLTQGHYLDTLSPGIQKSIKKRMNISKRNQKSKI